MKNLIILIAALISLNACAMGGKPAPKPVEPVKVETPETSVSSVDLVTVKKFTGFYKSEIEKAWEYIPKMNETIGSKCFEDFFVAREAGKHSSKYKLHSTNGKSAKEVVKHLRSSNVEIELITYYKKWSKVAGYTYPNVNKIWLNRKYHSGASLCSEGSNLAHELSHKLGYGHAYKATYDRPYTVPYSINAAFKACCK